MAEILHKDLTGADLHENKVYLKTSAPTVNDDSSAGYVIGSQWIDIITKKEYTCLDNTVGTAVWKESTPPDIIDGGVWE